MTSFDSILVANRGEIAVRIIRSAQQLGYRAIAVYSEADANSLHVQLADEAVLIGPPSVTESYRDPARILRAAEQTGAEAIHPGYGFLSENADFAAACVANGLVFIGPSPEAIALMGNKAEAKKRMQEAGVPCIPGYWGEDQSDARLMAEAEQIGLPLMVKAVAGGGGRGMRLVENLSALGDALASARSEAKTAFGCGDLMLEKAVIKPRHVEIQVFGDQQGNVIHFGERDCSIQRRHQKVVEESPCPAMTPALRQAMGQAAVDAAKSIGYVGAGTVEFLLDEAGHFYFLEMNTRLQVEHPVTEMVTGHDLVALQLSVAEGCPLPVSQEQIRLSGHAIEVRLYAEDTANDFLPATGSADLWLPPEGEGVRVDHGLVEGQAISPFYDPMLAKIIAWGEDRNTARRRLLRALQQCFLFGVQTNREFLLDLLQQPAFVEGAATTALIEDAYTSAGISLSPVSTEHLLAAACIQYRAAQGRALSDATAPVRSLAGFRAGSPVYAHFRYGGEDNPVDMTVDEISPGCYDICLNDEHHQVKWISGSGAVTRMAFDGVQKNVVYAEHGAGEISVQLGGSAQLLRNCLNQSRTDASSVGSGQVVAPMHGNLQQILVAVGDQVSVGQTLAVMEAMKMEHRLLASADGLVESLHAEEGSQLAAGALVMEITTTQGQA